MEGQESPTSEMNLPEVNSTILKHESKLVSNNTPAEPVAPPSVTPPSADKAREEVDRVTLADLDREVRKPVEALNAQPLDLNGDEDEDQPPQNDAGPTSSPPPPVAPPMTPPPSSQPPAGPSTSQQASAVAL